MCQKCIDAVKKHYPNLPKKDYGELLMSATAFPFGQPEYIEKQLKELKRKTDGTLDGAIAYTHQQLHRAMAKIRKRKQAAHSPILPSCNSGSGRR